MILSGKEKITLRSSATFMKSLERDSGILWRSMACAGGQECDCVYRENTILIRNLVTFQHWAYCDDKDSIIESAKIIRKNHISEFSFVFPQKLFRQFFNDKSRFAELNYLLAVCGLEFEASRYSESCCTVTLLDIKPSDSFAGKASTLSEMKEIIRNGFWDNKTIFDLWLSPSLFKKVIRDPQLLFSVLRDIGINTKISWAYNQDNSRIQIQLA